MGWIKGKGCLANLLVLSFLLIAPAEAGGLWSVEPSSAAIAAEPGAPATDGLPDGRIAEDPDGDIAAAWYADPTTRYRHAVLGDGIEAGALVVETRDGKRSTLVLPQSEVFEDRTPRLADLDGDGRTEVITIRSSSTQGSSVTLYGLSGNTLVEMATSGFIGRANRWLNVAGIADFDGRPGREIAFVRTPHIGGTLFFFGFRDGVMTALGSIDGFSNHVIGSREMRLSAITDVDGDGRPDLALPSDDRRTLRIIALRPDGPEELFAIGLPGRIDKAIGVEGSGPSTAFTVGLDDGSVYRISRQ